jgi:hypothetical protein
MKKPKKKDRFTEVRKLQAVLDKAYNAFEQALAMMEALLVRQATELDKEDTLK